jgi:teichuronic acid biosynthesis glycosyltransferase TuaC
VYQTLRHLQHYADVQVVCPLPRYPTWLQPKFDHRRAELDYRPPEVPASYFEYPAIPGMTRPINGLTCAHYLQNHIAASKSDVILNFWLYPAGFAAVIVGRKLGLPVVVGSVGSDLNAIGDPVSRWLTRKTLRGASRIIAKSEQLRREAIAMGADPGKLHVVSNGCDGNLFFVRDCTVARRELNVPAEAELIVFVGRMNRTKGIGELFESAAALFGKRPHLRVVYVGDGPGLAAIQEKTRAGGLTSRIFFAGACSSLQVAKWLASSNCLALPSYAEGCPNAVIEALSCGRPVVATSVGSTSELVDRRCGVLVPPRQVAALTDALDATLSAEWDENAIAHRFRREWDQVAQEVFAVCEASRQPGQSRSLLPQSVFAN